MIASNYDYLHKQLEGKKCVKLPCRTFDDIFSDCVIETCCDAKLFTAPEDVILKAFIRKFPLIEFREIFESPKPNSTDGLQSNQEEI